MNGRILLINDLPGYGKVALSAMTPVLSHLGFETANLPTALVSNTLDYGKFAILETTDYMRQTLAVWDALDFHFDAVSTGFIVSRAQTELTADFCLSQSRKGARVFVDPIMGDDGHLYNGITEETVALMRRLVSCADITVPNYTEAAYLTGLPYRTEGARAEELTEMVDALRALGARNVVITSAPLADTPNRKAVAGYDSACGSYFTLPFEEIPVRFPGTGDIFSAVLMGRVMEGRALKSAAENAMDAVRRMIALNRDKRDKFKGIPLETCLEVLDA